MFKPFKRSPRRASALVTTLLSAILSGFPVSLFFIFLWKGPSHTFASGSWETDISKWIIYPIILYLVLLFFYRVGLRCMPDKIEWNNFHDGFWIGFLASVIIASLIVLKDFVNNGFRNWILVLVAIVVICAIYLLIVLRVAKRPNHGTPRK